MTERTTPAAAAGGAAARGARRRTGTYKTVEVPAIELALLLDWCDKSQVKAGRGKAIGISKAGLFHDAYRSCQSALRNEQAGVRHGV